MEDLPRERVVVRVLANENNHKVMVCKEEHEEVVGDLNGNCDLTKTTCRDLNMCFVRGLRHLYEFVSREYLTKTHGWDFEANLFRDTDRAKDNIGCQRFIAYVNSC